MGCTHSSLVAAVPALCRCPWLCLFLPCRFGAASVSQHLAVSVQDGESCCMKPSGWWQSRLLDLLAAAAAVSEFPATATSSSVGAALSYFPVLISSKRFLQCRTSKNARKEC